jgi:hypothetical protein
VNQQAKVGWSGGELYLEVQPTQRDADAIEAEGAPRSSRAVDADDLVTRAAGAAAGRLDWHSIHLAETRATAYRPKSRERLPTDKGECPSLSAKYCPSSGSSVDDLLAVASSAILPSSAFPIQGPRFASSRSQSITAAMICSAMLSQRHPGESRDDERRVVRA